MSFENISFEIRKDSAFPLYIQFKEQLKNFITAKSIPPGTKLPDIKTLAEQAGVSIKTVNSGLNELLRDRIIMRRPKKGTYTTGSQQLQQTSRKKICIFYHKTPLKLIDKDSVRIALLHGVQDGCAETGTDLIFVSGDIIETIEMYLHTPNAEITGIIFFAVHKINELGPLSKSFPLLRFFYLNDYSRVFENMPRNVYGIFHDDFAGGYQIGSAFAACDVKKFGLVGINLSSENYSRRAEGFRTALKDNGFDTGKVVGEMWETLADTSSENLLRMGYRAACRLLNMPEPPQAVFLVNDFIAKGFWDKLKETGREKDIIISGYDNIFPEISQSCHFSTVDINFYKMGHRVVEQMTSDLILPQTIFMPPQVINRISKKGD